MSDLAHEPISRRAFLQTLASLAVAARLGPEYVSQWDSRRVIRNQVFYLDAPMVIDLEDDFEIVNCWFIATDQFSGGSLLEIHGGRGIIQNCRMVYGMGDFNDRAVIDSLIVTYPDGE